MKTLPKLPYKLVIPGIICALVILAGCSKDPVICPADDPASEDAVFKTSTLTDDEIESIMYMVEEEKLAMDVYVELFNMYGLQVFEQISVSESKHVDAMVRLIAGHNLENPIEGMGPGEFVNPILQELYNDLMAQAETSKLHAINVAITIENTDITDIQNYLDNVVEAKDLEQVYTHLLNGSVKHLEAFESELE